VCRLAGGIAAAGVLWLAAGPALAAGESIGRVISVAGQVVASVPDGGTRVLQRRSRIYTDEVIHTGAGERVQIRFRDGGLVDLQPGTRFRVDEYDSGDDDEGGNVLMNLLTGALRTITGAIGDDEDDTYRMETPVATIGVRGTQYALQYCAADCASGDAGRGLFGRVDRGSITVTNDWGARSFGRTRFFRVRSRDSAPQGILQPPGDVLQQATTPAGEGNGDEHEPLAAGGAAEEDGALEGASLDEDSTSGTVDATAEGDLEFSSSDTEVDPTLNRLDGVMAGGVVGQPSDPSVPEAQGGLAAFPGSNSTAFLDADGRITRVEFDNPDAGQESIEVSDATHVAGGEIPSLSARWGRWDGVVDVTNSDTSATVDGSFMYAYSTDPTTSTQLGKLSGTATYQLAGGPQAVGTSGDLWTVDTLSMGVDFTQQTVTGSIAMSDGATTLNVSQTGGSLDPDLGVIYLGNLSGSWTDGASGTGMANGYLEGHFIGDQADGALAGFQVRRQDTDGVSTFEKIQGVKVLEKQ